MPATRLGFDSVLSRRTSFLRRIRENSQSVWTLPRVALAVPRSADGLPIHLLDERRAGRNAKAQFGSIGACAVICGGLILAVWHPVATNLAKRPATGLAPFQPVEFAAPKWMREASVDSAGKRGTGGDGNPLPPTAGEWAPPSKIVFSPPRLPDGRLHPLTVQVTTFDADAPELSPPVEDLGLPWMTARNNSAGPGTNGVGTQPGGGMGNGPGDGSGWGEGSQPYARATTQVVCLRCPDPLYSDEARKAKMQGQVTMRVLVGADGHARDIQVTRGIGLGLDENAVRAVRGWQFVPAKDAARRPVATWITIETVFRLF
ncbi:MAG TPA: energy transducer TonB [Acidobacteriota bacterium]|nr:energy transducer TonB [Acidobacteriota bacterium]